MNEYMSWYDFDKACKKISKFLKQYTDMKNIYGIPRGGLILAVKLSNLLDIPLILDESKITQDTVIVDDIADTGKQLGKFKEYPVITLYYHKQSTVIPVFYVYEKKDKWIVFPWEK